MSLFALKAAIHFRVGLQRVAEAAIVGDGGRQWAPEVQGIFHARWAPVGARGGTEEGPGGSGVG